MKSNLLIIMLAFGLLVPLGCFTTRGKAPSIKEAPPTPKEQVKEEAPPEEAAPPEEEKAAPPPVEEVKPKPEEKTAPPKEEKAETSPLPGGGTLHNVVIYENTLKLTPAKITVKVGDTVRFENKDNKKHFLASVPGSGTSDKLEIFSLMPPGFSFEHTFTVAGVYPYFCFIHNQMTGEITVVQ